MVVLLSSRTGRLSGDERECACYLLPPQLCLPACRVATAGGRAAGVRLQAGLYRYRAQTTLPRSRSRRTRTSRLSGRRSPLSIIPPRPSDVTPPTRAPPSCPPSTTMSAASTRRRGEEEAPNYTCPSSHSNRTGEKQRGFNSLHESLPRSPPRRQESCFAARACKYT